jgi:serine/threonine protein kinase
MKEKKNRKILEFDFPEGKTLSNKFEIISKLGEGYEGEVYLVREISTGIERAAKFFFPHRNDKNRNLLYYAKKLHRLRNCPIVTQYYTMEKIIFKTMTVNYLVSEFVEGMLLSEYIKQYPKGKVPYYEALHILYALACGMEDLHLQNEYHGDIHTDNIIISRRGLDFNLKVFDMYHLDSSFSGKIKIDVQHMIKLFYEILGGPKHYSKHPAYIKTICCGCKNTLINKKFRSASQLRYYLESMDWD